MIQRSRVCVLAACLALIAMVAPSHAELVGYWPLDGDANDLSPNMLHGTVEGDHAFTEDVPEALGGGMSILLNTEAVEEGDWDDSFIEDPGFVDLGNEDILNFSDNDWSISAWMKVPELLGPRGNIFSNGGDNGGGVRYVLAYDEVGNEGITLTTDDNTDKRQASADGFDFVVNDEGWHHVVGLRQDTELRVYVDGEFAGENLDVPEGYDLSETEQLNAYIGLGADSASGDFEKFFQGWIDDVALFSHALTEDEIANVMKGDFSAYGIVDSCGGDFNCDGAITPEDVNALIGNFGGDDSTYDLNEDGMIDGADLNFLVKDLANSWIGDADMNGEFNSGDFVDVFTVGKYETGQAAGWEEGDWDGDGVFSSGDFVAAFTDGGYEQGPRPAPAAVPEPSSVVLLLLGALMIRRRMV